MIKVDEITLAYLQVNNPTMACDFSDFHKAVEKVLDRPVWTHQFASKETLLATGMYDCKTPMTNLSNEDIKEKINKEFKKYCDLQNKK